MPTVLKSPPTADRASSSDDEAPPRNEGRPRWPLERVLFLMAGTMTGLSALLSALLSPWFLLLTAFVALNQLAFVAFGNCPSSLVLRRHFGLRSGNDR